MKRSRYKRIALLSLTLLALLVVVPLVATWRTIRQNWLNHALILACKQADDKAAKRLLEQGANPNCREEPSRFVSPWQRLLELLRGRQVNPAEETLTPLHYAVFWTKVPNSDSVNTDFFMVFSWLRSSAEQHSPIPGNPELVRVLLEHGADVNAELVGSAGQRWNPLFLAILAGRSDMVHLLFSHGARVDPEDTLWILRTAYEQADASVVVDLMADGVWQDREGVFATAICNGNVPVVAAMLAHRGSMKDMYGRSWSDLIQDEYAAAQNRTTVMPDASRREIIRLLKAAGAKQ